MPQTDEIKKRLIVLYQEMSDHTKEECASECRVPHSCCSPEYCLITKEIAKQEWGVDLKETGHPTLPFMGENGCTVKPHLRPLCTNHVCSINNVGCKVTDLKWTEEYFRLREEITELEYKRHEEEASE